MLPHNDTSTPAEVVVLSEFEQKYQSVRFVQWERPTYSINYMMKHVIDDKADLLNILKDKEDKIHRGLYLLLTSKLVKMVAKQVMRGHGHPRYWVQLDWKFSISFFYYPDEDFVTVKARKLGPYREFDVSDYETVIEVMKPLLRKTNRKL